MRNLLRGLALIVTVVLLGVPALASLVPDETSGGADPVRITSYDADFVVLESGRLVAKETLTTEFPIGRHGIFRFWDLADPSDSHVRLKPENVKVSLDGDDVPYDLQWSEGRHYRVAKIGDPDAYVSSGTHVYTIQYEIDGALSPTDAGSGTSSSSWTDEQSSRSVFYWNVVPQGWQMEIEKTQIELTLPAASGKVQCTSGFDSDGPCDVEGAGTDRVTLSTGALAPHTPVTVRVGLPVPTPDRHTVPWPVGADRALGSSLPALVLVVAVSLVMLGLGYWLERRAREERPGYPVQYEPPPGLGPVQTAYIADERVPERSLVATLLYQAEQGLTRLTANDDGSWTVTGLGDGKAWAATDDVTRHVGTELGVTREGASFTARKGAVTEGQQLQKLTSELPDVTSSWASGVGAQRIVNAELLSRVAVIAAAIAFLGIGIFLHPPVSIYLLPLAAFVIGGAGLVTRGVGRRRTPLGRDLWSRAGGFERLLSTTSAQDRFDFSGRTELYTAYIPYAVAFDCADRWAKKYELTTGSPAPVPLWFGGGASTTTGRTGGIFGNNDALSGFESTLASSISAYAATQSSSSSSGGGGGGGGFSGGGGGGGGGGGSW
jgi:uncharacterized membrane protein YgcG